jgi:TonB family protein
MLLVRHRASIAAEAMWCACAVAACSWFVAPASAQSAAAASAPNADISPAERAQRDADKVFRWILIHSDKPRSKATAKDEKPAPAVAPVARSKPAARPTPAKADADAPVPTAAAKTAPVDAATPPPPRVEAAPTSAPPVTTAVRSPPSAMVEPAAVVTAPAEVLAEETLVPLSQVEPKVPSNVQRGSRNGEVQVRFTVLPDGSVAEPKVASSSNPRLNSAALAAVAQWRFAPLRKAQTGTVELVFNLE